jgi:acetylornithine deacetylase/succinyl-diaminopimelate desuccinylase-like protein
MILEHRQAIRGIADNDLSGLSFEALLELGQKGYVSITLTEKGKKAHKEIMKSGDGPEGLKELFRM